MIPKQDFDTRKTLYDGSVAAVASAQAKIPQCRANVEQALHFVEQNKAQVVHTDDVLNKTTYRAPIDGVVTYISVRKGENMVPGIENSTGSYMMTISDMSIVTSEVMVDETDIINIRAGQAATITVDALPGQPLPDTSLKSVAKLCFAAQGWLPLSPQQVHRKRKISKLS